MTENHETQSQEQAAAVLNGQSTDEQLAAITAQLEEERKARADIEASVAAKDTRIQELEAEVQQATGERDQLTGRIAELQEVTNRAVESYRSVVVRANPQLPPDLITGTTIEEVDRAMDRARSITDQVRKNLEAQAAATRVPAGAPAQQAPSLEGLTSRQLIEQGISARRK
jgi:chromosome segregation ATPase